MLAVHFADLDRQSLSSTVLRINRERRRIVTTVTLADSVAFVTEADEVETRGAA